MYIGFEVLSLSKFSSFFVSIVQRGCFNHLRVSCQHIAQSPQNSSVLASYRDILLYHQVLPFVERVCVQIRFSYLPCFFSLFQTRTLLEPCLDFPSWWVLNVAGQLFYRMCFHLVLSDVFCMIRFILRIFSQTISKGLLSPFNILKWSLCLICHGGVSYPDSLIKLLSTRSLHYSIIFFPFWSL